MVPVGGAVIAGFDENFIQEISKMYPGMLILFKLQTCYRWVIYTKLISEVYMHLVADTVEVSEKQYKNAAVPLTINCNVCIK